MDGQEPDDALPRRREHRLGRGRIEVERHRIDVGEERRGAEPDDRARGGPEAERRGEHRDARPDPEGAEHEEKGVGAGADADRVRHAAVCRHRGLEALHLLVQMIAFLPEFGHNCFLLLQRTVLGKGQGQ